MNHPGRVPSDPRRDLSQARHHLATSAPNSRAGTVGVTPLLPHPKDPALIESWLAADGLSNREIGERPFLSHRTVGSHLYRIFPKLDITSRAQLATRLESA